MAAKKMTKAETVNSNAEKPIENKVDNKPDENVTPVTVDADALIKSILSNVNTNNVDNNHSKQYIMCRSVTNGGLNINCKSGNVYEFKAYGTDCEIEYHDLTALVRKHSDHLFNPRIIVEDEDFLSEFPQLLKVYEKMYTRDDIDKILELPVEQMVSAIKDMPETVFCNMRNIIATKIANGSIDSVRRIRALSELFESDFNLLSELFSK